MPPLPKQVVMGRILGPFGVRGWVKIRTFTETLDGLVAHPVWQLGTGDQWRDVSVEDTEVHSAQLVAKLKGVDDRDQAFALRGTEIAVNRDALPLLDEDEFYWADLIGLDVVNLQGEALGKVESLLETGANDVLVVRGDVERLLPYVDAIVREVSLAEGRILVDWGLDY